MQYAIDIAPLGDLADPDAIVRLAREAEAAGWDGLSIWDSLGVSMGTAAPDPFVALAGVAAATERSRLILSVVALPRRRPQLVAQSAATLDRLSGGRLVLGIGAGGDPGDFTAFGEDDALETKVARLDEAGPMIDAWLRGQPVDHDGPAYVARNVAVGPSPLQQPRPPIWLGGMRPGALRRAARFDGWIAIAVADDGSGMNLTPAAFGDLVAGVQAERRSLGTSGAAFDIAVFGMTSPGDRTTPAAFAAAGATWWLESLSPMRGSLDELVALVAAGPPRP